MGCQMSRPPGRGQRQVMAVEAEAPPDDGPKPDSQADPKVPLRDQAESQSALLLDDEAESQSALLLDDEEQPKSQVSDRSDELARPTVTQSTGIAISILLLAGVALATYAHQWHPGLGNRGGFVGCAIVVALLGGVNAVIAGIGLKFMTKHQRPAYMCISIGCGMLIPLVPVIMDILAPNREALFIPENVTIDEPKAELVRECHCVIFGGIVILTPLTYDFAAIAINMVASSIATLFKLIYRTRCHLFRARQPELAIQMTLLDIHACIQLPKWKKERVGKQDEDEEELEVEEESDDEEERKKRPDWYYLILPESADFQEGQWIDVKLPRMAEWSDAQILTSRPTLNLYVEGFTTYGVEFIKEGQTHRAMVCAVFQGDNPVAYLRQVRIDKLGDLLFRSIKVPSMVFVVPSFLYHIVHYFILLERQVDAGWNFYSILTLYMSFVNSGMAAFLMMGSFGFMLADNEMGPFVGGEQSHWTLAFWKSPIWFRETTSYILMILLFPALPYTMLGFILFPWFYLEVELGVAMITFLVFPDVYRYVSKIPKAALEKLSDMPRGICGEDARKQMKEEPLKAILFIIFICPAGATFLGCIVVFFAGFAFLELLIECLNLDIEDTSFSPAVKASAISFFCLLKVIQWQFSFNAAVLYLHMCIPYWDALPLNLLARHNACNACLMQSHAQQANDLGHLAWAQFFSLF